MKRWLLVLILCIFGCSSKSGLDTAIEAGIPEETAKKLDETMQRVDPGYQVVRMQPATNVSLFQSEPFSGEPDMVLCVVISLSGGNTWHLGIPHRDGESWGEWLFSDQSNEYKLYWNDGGCGEW